MLYGRRHSTRDTKGGGDRNSEQIGTEQAALSTVEKSLVQGGGYLRPWAWLAAWATLSPAASCLPCLEWGPAYTGLKRIRFHTRRTFLELPGVPRPEISQVFIQMRIPGIIVLKWTLFIKFDPGKHWSRLGYLKTMLLFNVSFFIYLFLGIGLNPI